MTPNREYPPVSIITLNFNGLVFLEPCLSSLEQLNYPHGMFEVILVDNASTDQSVDFVRKQFSWVKIIQNESNLGFAAGNNVGIRESKGDYIALLNNDTKVEKDWLIELVKVCLEDPAVGACTSKILLFNDRLRVRMKTIPFRPLDLGVSQDPRELGVLIEEVTVRRPGGVRKVEFIEGFFPEDRIGETIVRWSRGEGVLSIPIEPGDRRLILELRVSNPRPWNVPRAAVSLWVGDRQLAELNVEYTPRLFQISLERDVLQYARPVIQNAGSMILRDGSSRDRGALVRDGQEVFEEDSGQYNRVEEVFAACGAGALYRRTMLEDVGLLDEYFFMYYEDTDLAWRARLKGWKIMYTPHAVMRHVHCGTSIEWSPSFMFHAYRNRLAMVLKNAPMPLALVEWAKGFASLLMLGFRIVIGRTLRRVVPAHLPSNFTPRARGLRSLVLALPELFRKRKWIQKTKRVLHDEVIRWMQPLQ